MACVRTGELPAVHAETAALRQAYNLAQAEGDVKEARLRALAERFDFLDPFGAPADPGTLPDGEGEEGGGSEDDAPASAAGPEGRLFASRSGAAAPHDLPDDEPPPPRPPPQGSAEGSSPQQSSARHPHVISSPQQGSAEGSKLMTTSALLEAAAAAGPSVGERAAGLVRAVEDAEGRLDGALDTADVLHFMHERARVEARESLQRRDAAEAAVRAHGGQQQAAAREQARARALAGQQQADVERFRLRAQVIASGVHADAR